MHMQRLSKIDWSIIDARVNATKQERALSSSSKAYLLLVLSQFFPSSGDDVLESITDGPNDRGVDALHIVERDDSAEIYVFQCKYRDDVSNTDRTVNDSEVLKLSLFIEELFDKSEHMLAACNVPLREAIKHVWDLHHRGIICRYQIIICSNDRGLSQSARTILEQAKLKYSNINFENYGPSDLIRDLGSRTNRSETGSLQVIGKEVFDRSDGDVRGLVATISAVSLIDLITTPTGGIKRYLFDDNLRVFLGSSGGYNQSIIQTATSNDRHLFWYLNNGITITCRNYSYNKGHVNPKIRLEDFQIVNGAQTSHSLIEVSRFNPDVLNDILLNVRIYATDREDIVERVAVATNSQARIQNRDLRANSDILRKLELAFRERGYFLERKRNMYAESEPAKRVDALKLGQILLTYYFSEPDRAKTESDAIFGSRFNQLFNETYDIDELVNLVNIYGLIEEKRDAYLLENEGGLETGSDLQYLVYGHWFILYAIRLLLRMRAAPVPSGPAAEELVNEAIRLVARACAQSKAVAHYQIFRSPRTKDKILAELTGKQGDFFQLLARTSFEDGRHAQ
jgi:hypothetical protein